MQVTRAGEYGIIGLLYLARQPPGRTVMVDEISASEKIPKSFLAKIFQSLVKAGLVQSVRGAKGGFRLAKPPSKITVLEILNCVEDGFALQKCVTDRPKCVVAERRVSGCALCQISGEAQHRLNEVLSRTTLEQLLKTQPEHANH
ncbi:MAG: Rrf2 family transcriptional regulator [Verrucomicrobiae bacterium]|nr:Rrf2 family transcriptional regulator [Verrucomicrobiae bacterium]